MQDNEFARSTNPRRPARKAHGRPQSPGVLETQAILCMVCLLAALLLKFMGGGLYAGARKAGKTVVRANISAGDVQKTFRQIRSEFPDAVWVFDKLGSGISASGANGVSSGAGASSSRAGSAVSAAAGKGSSVSGSASSAKSSSVSGSASSAKQVSGSKAASSAVSASSKVAKTSLKGVGGAELNAPGSALGVSALTAPAGTSLAPVLLTMRPRSPLKGSVTSKFGYRISPITGKLSFHTGLDIAAASGTPIRAALPGMVRAVEKSATYGNYIVLDHGGGVTTLYAHCSKIVVPKGQAVKAGEVIAKVGSTGEATGPHCHFELRINGVRVNPLPVLV